MATPVYQVSVSESFPLLTEIHDAPKTLFARGALPPRGYSFLTIVGSRALSAYGKEALHYLVRGISSYPISIVSGLALGADGEAHRAALEYGMHTIAVPGSGIDDAVLYPRSHRHLAGDILSHGGALLCEHAPDARATTWSFPKRNRIMAGIARATLMIEAGEKSGTLITARMTSEYNRELLAIPHPIFSSGGKGPHQFLRLGATLVCEPEHILEALGIPVRAGGIPREVLMTVQERALLDALCEPRSRDELIRVLGVSASTLSTLISTLELKGFVREAGGVFLRTHE